MSWGPTLILHAFYNVAHARMELSAEAAMLHHASFWDELAIQSYRAILKDKPDCALVHKNLGLAYLRTGKVNRAVRSFQRAVKCNREYTEAYYHLGKAYQTMGKLREAVCCFDTYKQLIEQQNQNSPIVAELLNQLRPQEGV